MAPTARDYVTGLRRMWWVPLAAVLAGAVLGFLAAFDARPTVIASGNALFTFRIDDAGEESAGSARGAEATVAQSRLGAYVAIFRGSERARLLLEANGIKGPPTTLSSKGGFEDPGAQVLVAVSATGLVESRVKVGLLDEASAAALIKDLNRAVVEEVTTLDATQEAPSIRSDALVTEAQITEEPASRVMRAAMAVFLLAGLGLAIVYLLVWRQGRINRRRDIEERLGARVLGDLSGAPADAATIALAMGRGRNGVVTALVVPCGSCDGIPDVGRIVAAAGKGLGLDVRSTPVDEVRLPQGSTVPGDAEARPRPAPSLIVVDACATGLDADALREARTADIVALVVEYGRTSYRELAAAGQMLAEVTEAEIAVIGLHGRAAQGSRSGSNAGSGQEAAAPTNVVVP